MKKLKLPKGILAVLTVLIVVASLLVLSIFAGSALINNADGSSGDNTEADTPYVPEKRTYKRPEETYEGVQGIMLRSTVSNVNASILPDTQVTDYIIIADGTNPSSAITAINAAGVNAWMSVPVAAIGDDVLADIEEFASSYDIYGIELDFCGMTWTAGAPNCSTNAIDAFVSDAADITKANDIKLSTKVYSDINTSYTFGLNVCNWVSNGYVDMVSPSSGSEYSNTDMSLRLWASLLDPSGVVLAPYIGGQIKNYSSSTTVTAQTAETLAGEAAVAIAHGADKICLNEYVNANMLKVVGSYDTVMAHDRVHHVTYNSAVQNWVNSYNNQLPKTFNQSTNAIRIPIGNIPEGATVKVRITYENAYFQYTNSDSEYESTYPSDELPSVKVYVNSQECIYNGAVNGTKVYGNGSYEFMDRFVQMGYDYNTFEYTVPEEGYITIEHDDGTEENILVFDLYDEGYGYIVFELLPDVDGESFKLYGVQVIVDVP